MYLIKMILCSVATKCTLLFMCILTIKVHAPASRMRQTNRLRSFSVFKKFNCCAEISGVTASKSNTKECGIYLKVILNVAIFNFC